MGAEMGKSTFQDQLTELRRSYLEQLPRQTAEIAAAWRCCAGSGWDAEQLRALLLQVHSMVGAAATYGYHQISDAARRVEQLLAEGAPEQHRARLEALIDALAEAVRRTEDGGAAPTPGRAAACQQPEDVTRRLLLVDDDPQVARELEAQLQLFGYAVSGITSLAELPRALEQLRPAAVVMDLMFPEGEVAGARALAALAAEMELPPVVFTSARTDLQARLEAVRAGGKAYFPKPIPVGDLVDALDRLTHWRAPAPYRVLIVDDVPMLAAHAAAVLRREEMVVEVVHDPQEVLARLASFEPDLVLMDLYMPFCTGQELAAVIRQQSMYVGLPIVFLSAERDRDAQLAAIAKGGDDFLTKPVQPEHLVAAVSSRIDRARAMRAQMLHDGLTGLLNHSAFGSHLDAAVARGQRAGKPLALALIDVDHFKQVNDTYGHLAGDRVLKSLARLLQQGLRRSDIVGRYGGEEFAVILQDTDAPTAVLVMDRLREQFAQIHHQIGAAQVSATISAGIVAVTGYASSPALLAAADAALYQAKRAGRNQVRLAADLAADAVLRG
jgi:diguanylate cyclase (GGDEF)-like protein